MLRRIFGCKRDEVTASVENYRKRILMIVLTQHCSGDQIEKNEMGGECSTYGGKERRIEDFDGETQGKETSWKTQV